MKRLKAFLIAVCLVVTMVGVSSVVSALDAGTVLRTVCPLCGNYSNLIINSFKKATASSSGYISVSCPLCSQVYSRTTKYWVYDDRLPSDVGFFDVVVAECPHHYAGAEEAVVVHITLSPTCNAIGACTVRFLSCGAERGAVWISSLPHSWNETSRTPATCVAPGSILSTCSRCGETKTEAIPIIDHTWKETSRIPATCLPGSIEYACSTCNQTKTEPLPADPNAHTWTETSRIPATCLPGSIEYTCSTCQETKTEPIPALENAHTYEVAEIVPAEYDTDGNLVTASYIRYSCSACGDSYNSTIGGNISGPIIDEGAGGSGMTDSTAALGKTLLSGLWALFGIYVPGFSFTFGQMWLGVLLASVSILVIRMIFGFGGSGGVSPRTSSTSNAKISKERRHDEF